VSRGQVFTVIEHLISTRPGRGPVESPSKSGAVMIEATRKASREWGFHFIDYDDPRQGIAHVVAPELGIAFPGATLVCCDSHTSTVGGVGALAWGIGASEAEHVLATQALAQARPRTLRVTFDGRLREGVFAKDMILALIGQIGAQGGIGFATEYAGSAVASLPIEGRLTLCNMSIEFQSKYGFVPPDDATLEYLAGREFSPKGAAWDRGGARTGARCRPIKGARFDQRGLDRLQHALEPLVTLGSSPQQVTWRSAGACRSSQAADSGSALARRGAAARLHEPRAGNGSSEGACRSSGRLHRARAPTRGLSDLRGAAACLRGTAR
jgi:3-isopropylmalate/(R)-2-methylmalate dehydratase large subunit